MYFSFKPRVYVQGLSKTPRQISGVSARQYMAANRFFFRSSCLSELSPSDVYVWGDLKTLVRAAPTENEETHHRRIF
jgi:hypothetical protein